MTTMLHGSSELASSAGTGVNRERGEEEKEQEKDSDEERRGKAAGIWARGEER